MIRLAIETGISSLGLLAYRRVFVMNVVQAHVSVAILVLDRVFDARVNRRDLGAFLSHVEPEWIIHHCD